jgi:histidinol-phosphatase
MAHSELLTFALDLAAVAAKEILPRFQMCTISQKDDGTVVTEADRVAEREMRRCIRGRYPSHGIVGEEEGATLGTTERQWFIDPIDGTMCYSLGVPKFGTLIALLEEGRPTLGVIHLPVTRESVFAEEGGGCWYVRGSSSPQLVRADPTVSSLSDAFVSLSGIEGSEKDGKAAGPRLTRLIGRPRQIEFIGDCVQYALVARGRIHAALDLFMKPWDTAAVVPCIREAGGVVSTLEGKSDQVVHGGSLVASCTRRLHEEVLAAING